MTEPKVTFRVFNERDEKALSGIARHRPNAYLYHTTPVSYQARMFLYKYYGAFVAADENDVAVAAWAFCCKRVKLQGEYVDVLYGIDGLVAEHIRKYGIYSRLSSYAFSQCLRWMPNYLYVGRMTATATASIKALNRLGLFTVSTFDILTWETAEHSHSHLTKLPTSEVHARWESFYKDVDLTLEDWSELTNSEHYRGTLSLKRGEHNASISLWDRNSIAVFHSSKQNPDQQPPRHLNLFACEWSTADTGLLLALVTEVTGLAWAQGYTVCYMYNPSFLQPMKAAVEGVAVGDGKYLGSQFCYYMAAQPPQPQPSVPNIHVFLDPRDMGMAGTEKEIPSKL